jgi:biotin carboxylase
MTSGTHRPAVVIVDAYASARCLAPLFRARGVDCIHVRSTPMIPTVYAASFHPSDFVADIPHRGDVAATVEAIAAYAPIGLLPGIERAVMLADDLSERLGLPTNGTPLSPTRRDKFRMIETVKEAGVPGTDQILATDLDALLDWYGRNARRVVLKPVSSTGNDGVFFCDSASEVCAAFANLIGARSVLDQENRAVLAQEYLLGSEYIVNTVSLGGRTHVTDVWKMHHLSANGVRDLPAGAELLPCHGADQEALVKYTMLVLDALGIRNGPAHSELKLTPEGPRLVETGARVCGADVHVPAAAAIGESQLDWTVDAYADPERFIERWDTSYELMKHARIVNMVSPAEGLLVNYPKLSQIRELESFHDAVFRVAPGTRVSRSIDDWTFPLRVFLAHENESVVARDCVSVRYLDGCGFYQIL